MAWPLGGGGVAPVRVVLVWFLCGSSHLGVVSVHKWRVKRLERAMTHARGAAASGIKGGGACGSSGRSDVHLDAARGGGGGGGGGGSLGLAVVMHT